MIRQVAKGVQRRNFPADQSYREARLASGAAADLPGIKVPLPIGKCARLHGSFGHA
jgi:hypothetical protein